MKLQRSGERAREAENDPPQGGAAVVRAREQLPYQREATPTVSDAARIVDEEF